jgi:hypothetical protein
MAIDQFCLIIGGYFEKAFLRGGGLKFNLSFSLTEWQ